MDRAMGKKPLIRRNRTTGQMVAGFLDVDTGVFDVVMDIDSDKDIDAFMAKYDLSVVMMSKMEI